MLTQAEKEELWHAGHYERIVAHDIGWMRAVTTRALGSRAWAHDEAFSLACLYCCKACEGWSGGSFTALWSGCCVNAVRAHFAKEAQYAKVVEGKWCVGDEVGDSEPYKRGAHLLPRAMQSLPKMQQGAINGFLRGQTVIEVAKSDGCSHQAASCRTKRAIANLRQFMLDHGE